MELLYHPGKSIPILNHLTQQIYNTSLSVSIVSPSDSQVIYLKYVVTKTKVIQLDHLRNESH